MTNATPVARMHSARVVFWAAFLCASWGIGSLGTALAGAARSHFIPLVPLASPRIVASAEAYPGSVYLPQNIVDGNERTEYSSNAKGTATFFVFDFGKPTRLAAFEHVDRSDPATVATSELVLSDTADFAQARAKFSVPRAKTRAGDRPAKARVNWAAFRPKRVAISSPREEEGPAWSGAADLPPLGILALRAGRE